MSLDKGVEDELSISFNEEKPRYESLKLAIVEQLTTILKEAKISHLPIDSRVKDLDSFVEKIHRKDYKEPFNECEDICGIRVIVYDTDDITKVELIVDTEFESKPSEDKEKELGDSQFGYRSLHKIIKLKKEWLKVPGYKKLKDLKAEIQIRTVLSHAWADLSHDLGYKKEDDMAPEFKRTLFALSAVLELADKDFNRLRKDIEGYKTKLVGQAKADGTFDLSLPMNLDNLEAYLRFLLPLRRFKGYGSFEKQINLLISKLEIIRIDFSELDALWQEYKEKYREFEKLHWNPRHAIKSNKKTLSTTWILVTMLYLYYPEVTLYNLGIQDREFFKSAAIKLGLKTRSLKKKRS